MIIESQENFSSQILYVEMIVNFFYLTWKKLLEPTTPYKIKLNYTSENKGPTTIGKYDRDGTIGETLFEKKIVNIIILPNGQKYPKSTINTWN